VRQACILATEVPAQYLDKEMQDFKRRNPISTTEEALDHVVKWKVPPKLEGSPRDHRENLENLLTVASAIGLPHLLVTLTEDDASEVRWTKVDDLERILHVFGGDGMTFADAPVECSTLFVKRFKKLMDEDILNKQHRARGGIFGRVTAHMVRSV